MSIAEEITSALLLVRRYEKYKLMRAWGLVLIITGIGRFLLSWIIDQTLLFALNWDFETTAVFLRFFRMGIEVTLVGSIAIIILYSFLSFKRITLKEGGEIISSRDFYFGTALCFLFFLTFIARILASVYFEEVLAIFVCHFLLRRAMDDDFKEMYHLTVVLFLISMVELLGRIIIVVTLLYQPLFTPVWTTFYILLAIAFMIPYIYFGKKIWQKGTEILSNTEE